MLSRRKNPLRRDLRRNDSFQKKVAEQFQILPAVEVEANPLSRPLTHPFKTHLVKKHSIWLACARDSRRIARESADRDQFTEPENPRHKVPDRSRPVKESRLSLDHQLRTSCRAPAH